MMNSTKIAVAINEHTLENLDCLAGENQGQAVQEVVETQTKRLERSRLAREYLQWVGEDHRASR